ncbi:MAG: ribosomal protein [Actinomycetia bacterium]|nr:ribosomal protein [Actinomycetes bacterium]
MRPYEVMVILEPALEESAVQAVINRSTEQLESGGSTVNRVDKWGKRRFAYEIAKKMEGFYVLLDVTSEPAPMEELDRVLRLSDDVIRHKIMRIPDEAINGSGRKVAAEDIDTGPDRESRGRGKDRDRDRD